MAEDLLIVKPETVQEALVSAVRALGASMGFRAARLEAEILLAHTLGLSRAGLLARLGEPLSEADAAEFAGKVARRAKGEPLAYIRGTQEFYGLELIVDRRVQIPRPETELLVELALGALRSASSANPVVVDVGTGSGAIALAIAHNAPHALVFGTDLSPDALMVAMLNAQRLDLLDRVEFRLADLLEGLDITIDILVANLPYIPLHRLPYLPREIRDYEPRMAIIAGLEGLGIIRRLLEQARERVNRGGLILLEISEEQGREAESLAKTLYPTARIRVHKDLELLDRALEVRLAG